MTKVVRERSPASRGGRRRSVLIGSIGVLAPGGCLPPASLEPPPVTAAETPPKPAARPDRCRVLLGELDGLRYSTRELVWDTELIREVEREGLVVGDEDALFEVTLVRRPYDPSELYGDAGVVCEESLVMLRKLPDGLAHPQIAARPACTGTVEGESLALESSLQIVSVLGPLLGWREQVRGTAPEPTSLLDYRTLDVRDAQELDANIWLLEGTPSMFAASDGTVHGCKRNDVPLTTADIDGFAVRWPELDGPRLLVGYPCCDGNSCELDEPLPKVVGDLASRLPDPDRLLHSPHGCGSIGLDGKLRTRDGDTVARVELDTRHLIGVVFLPADHPFDIAW